MNARRVQSAKSSAHRQAKGRNTFVRSHADLRRPKQARRSSTGQRNAREPFAPPEDWYEPTESSNYRIVVQEPGEGYRHVVTPAQIRERLSHVPPQFLDNAFNKPGEFFIFGWNLYRDTLTLAPVDGAVSPENFRVKPWHRIATTPSRRFLNSRCPPPSNALEGSPNYAERARGSGMSPDTRSHPTNRLRRDTPA